MRSLLAAIGFLTNLPLGRLISFDAADVSRSAAWFPLVGLMLGAVYAAAATVLRYHLPFAVLSVLLVALDAFATGALHFDGLADTADGFGGGRTREDTLRIMRDHVIGSYGGLALALVVALKVTAYAALLQQSDWIPALLLAPTLGRWSILLLTAALPYARLSPSPIDGMGKRSLFWGTSFIVVSLMAARSLRSGIALAVVLAVTAMFGLYCRRRIGGITGDTLGASVELCESAVLLVFLWTGHSR